MGLMRRLFGGAPKPEPSKVSSTRPSGGKGYRCIKCSVRLHDGELSTILRGAERNAYDQSIALICKPCGKVYCKKCSHAAARARSVHGFVCELCGADIWR